MISRDSNHCYTDGEKKFISVTQQLCIYGLNDFSMVNPADLEHARLRGQYIHQAIKMLAYEDLEISGLDPGYRTYVEAYTQFQKDHGWEVFKTEEFVHDELLQTCGEYDQIGKKRNTNHLSLLDIKATATVSAAVRLQLAAYMDFYNQDPKNKEKIAVRGCLQLLPTGKYKIFWYKDTQDVHVFKFICRANWWSLSNGIIPLGAKADPKTYSLCQTIIKGG